MQWHESVNRISPSIVKIETPNGSGTGFICNISKNRELVAIATAAHVIENENKWRMPISIVTETGNAVFIEEKFRVIRKGKNQDSAILLFDNTRFGVTLPNETIPLIPKGRKLKVGVEVGWVGYPDIGSGRHFFSGRISAYNSSNKSYFIDGSAAPGVSGGPVFYYNTSEKTKGLNIIGSISAYTYSRESLTGLSIAQGVSELHGMITAFKDFHEAKENSEELNNKDAPGNRGNSADGNGDTP